jgi:hypothetical protein
VSIQCIRASDGAASNLICQVAGLPVSVEPLDVAHDPAGKLALRRLSSRSAALTGPPACPLLQAARLAGQAGDRSGLGTQRRQLAAGALDIVPGGFDQ